MLPANFSPEFLKRLELLKIHTSRAFQGRRQGEHISLKKGFGIEFSDYRKYELGDNPRHIDWGVYGRTDRFYVKRFREEENISILIAIDPSRSMVASTTDRKWEVARDLAMALSYITLMQQDSVILAPLGHQACSSFYGGRAFHQLAASLTKIKPGKDLQFDRELFTAANKVKFPGKAIVISDFLMPFEVIERGFNSLRAKNLEICAVQILGEHEVDPPIGRAQHTLVDSETNQQIELLLNEDSKAEYLYLLEKHNLEIRRYFLSASISYLQFVTSKPFDDLVFTRLPEIGLIKC